MSQSSNSSTKSSSSSHAREEFTAQPIERRKVDPMRLVQKLRDRYGTDENGKPNFHVTVSFLTFAYQLYKILMFNETAKIK
jgi:hypothetical protein